jgi:hypothetical protein
MIKYLAIVLCLVAGDAAAKDFAMTARSGQTTKMHVYRSWTKDCQSKLGVVKVITKPSHGTLTPTQVTSTIGESRRNPEKTAHCKGVPTNGFRVDYRSEPGFRGTDSFVIQFDYGRASDIDNYIVTVQ